MPSGVLWNMIEAFNDGVALADGEGTLVLASQRLEKMFGYQPTELAGQPLERLIPAHLQAVRARPVGTGALLTGLHKDGTTFPVEISLNPVQTTTGRFSFVVVRDMTAVCSLADVDVAAAAAQQVRRCQDLLDTVITLLYQVGVSLQTAADLPRDTARPHIEQALRILDDTISQIRDTTFADRGRLGSGVLRADLPLTFGTVSCLGCCITPAQDRIPGGPHSTRPFLLCARTSETEVLLCWGHPAVTGAGGWAADSGLRAKNRGGPDRRRSPSRSRITSSWRAWSPRCSRARAAHMLLNAYGWWKVSQITYIAAIASFALGGLALIGSLFALTLATGPRSPTRPSPLPVPRTSRPHDRGRQSRPQHDPDLRPRPLPGAGPRIPA